MSHECCEIPYEGVEEFVTLWNEAVKEISRSTSTHVRQQLSHASLTGSKRLVWLDMDMILFGIPRLDEIRVEIQLHLFHAIKSADMGWALKQTDKLLEHICHTSRIYFDTVRNHAVPVDSVFYGSLIESEISTRMGTVNVSTELMPFIFNYSTMVQDVFDASFVYNYVHSQMVSCWSNKQEIDIIFLLLKSCESGGLFQGMDTSIVHLIVSNFIRYIH